MKTKYANKINKPVAGPYDTALWVERVASLNFDLVGWFQNKPVQVLLKEAKVYVYKG